MLREHVMIGLVALLLPATFYLEAPAQASIVSEQVAGTTQRHFVDGLYGQVHVRIAKPAEGENAKPPLVLFHPSPYSSDYFKSFIIEMATDRLVVAIDTPGFGDSARPPAPPSIADYARNAAIVLEGLDIDGQIDLLGYHTGTLIAVELAIQNPDRVRRLVLPGVPYFTGEERAKALQRNAKPDNLERDGSHLMEKWDFALTALESGMSLERGQEHFADAMQAMPESGHAYYGVFTYPSDVQFPKIQQPVLYITTAGSLKRETEAAYANTTNAEIVHLEDFEYGIFDLGVPAIARTTRVFLDE